MWDLRLQGKGGVDQLIVWHGRMLESGISTRGIISNTKCAVQIEKLVRHNGIFGLSPTATFHLSPWSSEPNRGEPCVNMSSAPAEKGNQKIRPGSARFTDNSAKGRENPH